MQKTHFLRRMFCMALILTLTVALCCPAAFASFKVKINSSAAKVYSSPSANASASLNAVKGLTVSVTSYSGDWARISYNGRSGYMQIKYLTLSSRITAYAKRSSAVYRTASSSGSSLGTIPTATTVYIVGINGDYCRIQNRSGSVTGYIASSNLTTTKPSASASSGSSSSSTSSAASAVPASLRSTTTSLSSGSKVEYAIYLAQNQMGKPYSANANPPSSFDCARLVYYCYNHAGASVSSSAQSQGYDNSYTKITSTSSLKRGDMVCFNTNESDNDLSDHTGIYLGSGYFIHASSSAGKVILSSLNSGYYYRTFSWGRRIY